MTNDNIKGLLLNENVLIGSSHNSLAGVFATYASKNNHDVTFIVPNNSNVTLESNVFELSQARMKEANNYLIRANKSINGIWPSENDSLNNQLLRDYYIVAWCQRVYAVGQFSNNNSLLNIAGDLAWPAQMYIDRFLYDREPLGDCEFYMFDLKSENWFCWNTKWIRTIEIPTPIGIYAVLGSDKISLAAKIAIDSLWNI